MPRDDGVRYGVGGQVMQEIVELPKQEKSIAKKQNKKVQVLEERLLDDLPDEELEEDDDEDFQTKTK